MNKITFMQTTPLAGDCTACYDVWFSSPMTVQEFVDLVLTRHEWGTIYIYDPDNRENWYRRKECCEYKWTELKSKFPDEILSQTIKSATSHGGWSCMDYTLVL